MRTQFSRGQRRPTMLGAVAVGAAIALTTTFGVPLTAAADTGDSGDGVSSVNDTPKTSGHDTPKNSVSATRSPSRTTSAGADGETGGFGTSPDKPVSKVSSSPTVT